MNHLRCLHEFVKSQTTYYAQCYRHMLDLQKQLGRYGASTAEPTGVPWLPDPIRGQHELLWASPMTLSWVGGLCRNPLWALAPHMYEGRVAGLTELSPLGTLRVSRECLGGEDGRDQGVGPSHPSLALLLPLCCQLPGCHVSSWDWSGAPGTGEGSLLLGSLLGLPPAKMYPSPDFQAPSWAPQSLPPHP